ncbi:hypothetical protein GUJ93_ZPchr0007g4461 [Zizania palustris]|uniref:Arginine decarboxylase n=1 Tax=Zizania palustris TaxID=103762 RepID=A0A8J5VQE6_ZIZPA|nr:hypothetical protein GUJ93_ZPchr0007g4461 [Zizania palustris]
MEGPAAGRRAGGGEAGRRSGGVGGGEAPAAGRRWRRDWGGGEENSPGSSDMSVAYGLEQYASSVVVQAVRLMCDDNGVAHPVLCTESGRAMVSHHSMIILEALSAIPDSEPLDDEDTHDQLLTKIHHLSTKQPAYRRGGAAAAIGAMVDDMHSHATDLKKHGIEMYKLGKKLSKRVSGDASTIYNYHMNLSVFSLVPDFWGIGQLFPMMPVSRLYEEPTINSTLVDITCDSDGKIEKFILDRVTLPLHPLEAEGGYYVAALLSGAYQEALSCRHNLFSGPTLVRVLSESAGGGLNFKIASVELGPTSEEVIGTVQ